MHTTSCRACGVLSRFSRFEATTAGDRALRLQSYSRGWNRAIATPCACELIARFRRPRQPRPLLLRDRRTLVRRPRLLVRSTSDLFYLAAASTGGGGWGPWAVVPTDVWTTYDTGELPPKAMQVSCSVAAAVDRTDMTCLMTLSMCRLTMPRWLRTTALWTASSGRPTRRCRRSGLPMRPLRRSPAHCCRWRVWRRCWAGAWSRPLPPWLRQTQRQGTQPLPRQ